jgi:Uma2 family endonuclease
MSISIPTKNKVRQKSFLPHKTINRLGLPSEVRVPATFENWVELSFDCEYRVEYRNGHVISIFDIDPTTNETIGQASLTHEHSVANIGFCLSEITKDNPDCIVIGSNMPTYNEPCKTVFNPDVAIIKGEPYIVSFTHRKKTQNTLTNPCIFVEVLSQGTRNYDLIEKKNDYFKVKSIEQVIFIEQYYTQVMSYTRQEGRSWLYHESNEITGSCPVFDGEILLSDIYRKVIFPS